MKVISIKETSTTMGIITEMILNKKAQLYKAAKDFEIYQIKNSDIKIALVSINNTNFKNKEKAIEFNTQVIINLYQLTANLNKENLEELCKLNVFMH
jgi:UV DNA damage repair endonuclease